MHTVFALLCFVVVIHWLIFPYPSGLLHWHCGNLTTAPVPAKQPWWIWINTSCEFIMNDCITTTKQSTTKPCAYFLGYTVILQTLHELMMTRLTGVWTWRVNYCSGSIAGIQPQKRHGTVLMVVLNDLVKRIIDSWRSIIRLSFCILRTSPLW